MTGEELDRRTRDVIRNVTPETVLSSCQALVDIGFPAHVAFLLVTAYLNQTEAATTAVRKSERCAAKKRKT